eukprot:CAMPEP_0201530412 /NCGR_PEP_ID=MMETSP0161_2-20130828/44583_1 /ASSEMBLY_ACC=CAM_ASM_000251 /TAXON_ID=180227 /ORGANISM="Neoparamoeba aestuarina, Strain SoJaBio B1-5/56/2" /LENGTH=77 /DNA_ID=CAMNT_0047932757 /DNA_START=98 /DNA_END=328 /DNA_ORIENTATION=-
MKDLNVCENTLSGCLDLSQSPSEVLTLKLGKNDFCGSTDFRNLPRTLLTLDISYTDISGEILLTGNTGLRIFGADSQ